MVLRPAVMGIGGGMALWLGTRPAVQAQVRMSERGTVSQTVDGTVISLDYARPLARGRLVFGEKGKATVYWGEMWTPGANWATTLDLSRDVTIEGKPVTKGKYSMWVVPSATTWTVNLHQNARLFHDQRPRPDSMAFSFAVTPRDVPAVEALTFDFPTVTRSGTVIRLQWGTKALELAIGVASVTQYPTVSTAVAAPYLGRYDMVMVPDRSLPPEKAPGEVLFRNNHLVMEVGGFPMELVPTGRPHEFLLGFLVGDEIADLDPEFPVVFAVGGGRATALTGRANDGSEWIKGTRRPQ